MWPYDVVLDSPTQRMALALLHFLWQGALVAAIYSVAVEWFIRRPQRRYAAGVMALAVMSACLPITYWFIETPANIAPAVADAAVAANDADGARPLSEETSAAYAGGIEPLTSALASPPVGAGDVAENPASQSADGAALAIDGRDSLYGRIVMVWFIGVVAFSLRLAGGAIGLRLLARQTTPAAGRYVDLMQRLGQSMGLGRLPRLLVSASVAEAIASGFFRPVIVFPVAWLSELPPAVIEAVLAHELAHVRRYDLWVNLLQRVVEALLFFHPAVWWISRQVRSDREMCCDELAVAATGQKVAYVSALEVVARRAAREPLFSLATGIGGRKMQLLARVRYVLGLPPERQPGGWWAAGVLALAVPCGLWALSGPAAPRALAQEERRDDDDDREDRDEAGDRDEREDQDVREEAEERADAERERAERNRDRAERERDRAVQERERSVREADEERREIEVRRRRVVREQEERPRREGERPEEARRVRERNVEIEFDVRRDEPGRDPGPRASFEAQVRRAQQQARQAQQQAQEQARRALERAREDLEQNMSDARARIGEQLRGAEERGERERVEALRRELEAMQRNVEQQKRAIERQFAEMMAQRRNAEQERAMAQRDRAEQAEAEARRRIRPEGVDPQTVREMAAMVQELRQEVQQLRREVRELREGATRKDPAKKDSQPKGEAKLNLEAVPYLGKLFGAEKQPAKGSPHPKVSLDFDGKKIDGADLKLEWKIETKDFDKLHKDLEKLQSAKHLDAVKKDLEKLQKVYADQRKEATIEFKKAADKLDDAKVQLKVEALEKLKDAKVELEKFPVKKIEEAVIELKKAPVEKIKDVEIEIKRATERLKDAELEIKKVPEKVKDISIELKAAVIEKLKDAEQKIGKPSLKELEKAEVALKSSLEKIQKDDLRTLADKAVGDLEVRYAAKAAEVAKKELDKALDVIQKSPGVIPSIEIDKLKLAHEKTLLEVERAKREHLDRLLKFQKELEQEKAQQAAGEKN